MKVIKYHVEAADNAKFLTSLEKSSHAIYLEVNGSTAVNLTGPKQFCGCRANCQYRFLVVSNCSSTDCLKAVLYSCIYIETGMLFMG